jgi:hypothetical protein
MREYAWYSPEHNWIVFQYIMEDCYIAFEWDIFNMHEAEMMWGTDCDPMCETTWIPLGEL